MQDTLLPHHHALPNLPTSRPVNLAVGTSFVASSVLAFTLLFFPGLGYSFANVWHSSLLFLFFVAKSVSSSFYFEQVKSRGQNIQDMEDSEEKTRKKRHRHIIIGIGILGFVFSVLITAIMTWAHIYFPSPFNPAPTGFSFGSLLTGSLFVVFVTGSFLSLASRLFPENPNPTERKWVWGAAAISLLIALAFIVPMILSKGAFLGQLKALSHFTILGINVLIGLLFSLVSITSYGVRTSQYLRYLLQGQNKEFLRHRRWEYALTALGLLVGIALAAVVAALKVNPFGDGWAAMLGVAMMIVSACASLLSQIGRTFDEREKTASAKINWLTTINKLPSSYVVRRVLALGLFVLLGFSLAALSPFTIHSGLSFGPLSSPIAAFTLAALAVACIVNWGSLKHASVPNTPPCQAVAGAGQALEILDKLESETNLQKRNVLMAALWVHIEQAEKLLSKTWRESLLDHETARQGLNDYPRNDHYYLTQLISEKNDTENRYNNLSDELRPSKEMQLENAQTCNTALKKRLLEEKKKLTTIFSALMFVTIDPSFRPQSLSGARKIQLSVISIGALAAIIALLTWNIRSPLNLVAMPWILPLMAILAIASFGTMNHLLTNAGGGPYTTLRAIAIFAAVVLAGLTVLSLMDPGTVGIHAFPRLLPVLFSFMLLISVVCILIFGDKAAKPHGAPNTVFYRSSTDEIKQLTRGLTIFKIALALGFLSIAFINIGLLFHMSGLGPLNTLMQQMPAPWLDISAITVFAAAGFIAFELIKNILQTLPTSAEDIKTKKDWLTATTMFFKFTFVVLTAIPGLFSGFPGIQASMLPVFGIALCVMPFFSGKIQLPFGDKFPMLRKLEERLNRWFSAEPNKGRDTDMSRGWIIFKECQAIAFLGGLVGLSILIAGPLGGPVAGVAMAATLAFRWGNLWQTHDDPVKRAASYLGKPLFQTSQKAAETPIHACQPNRAYSSPAAAQKQKQQASTSPSYRGYSALT